IINLNYEYYLILKTCAKNQRQLFFCSICLGKPKYRSLMIILSMQHLNTYLKNLNIEALNPMQEEVLKEFSTSRDLVLLSPTGSGKTLAFSLLLFKLLGDNISKGTKAMIVVPTRELALQIESVIKQMNSAINVALLYGGNNSQLEKDKIKQQPTLIIGTPGRIIYHIDRVPTLLDRKSVV